MPSLSPMLWDALSTAGGSLALTFIVALALGINALTLLFLGSAVIALERFARAIRGWRSPLAVAFAWSAIVGVAAVYWGGPGLEDVAADTSPVSAGRVFAASAMAVATAVGLTALALRAIPASRLADGVLIWLGVAFALLAGSSGRLVYAAAPAVVAAGSALAIRLRRDRSAGAPRNEAERLLWVLAAALSVGIVLGLVLPHPDARVAAAGGAGLGAFLVLVGLGLLPLAAAGFLDTRGTVEWFIAVRYLVAKRRQTFISIITGICVIGIAAGVWLIITVLSVMNGFERTWRDEIIGNRSHFTVENSLGAFADYEAVIETITRQPEVVAASPYLDAEGMVRASHGAITAVRLRGIDPSRVGEVTDLREDLIAGSLEDLAVDSEQDPGIVIGSQLASAFGMNVGDPLLMISPFGGPRTPLGPAPRLKRFRVVGVFETSFFQFDEMFTYTSLPAARDFRRVGNVVDGIEARTTDFYRSGKTANAVQTALGFPFYTRDWKEFYPAFFQALKSERIMMFVLLTMIMVVAAFAIVSTLVMMIMEKSSDIAILKAMGARDDSIERIFAIEGTLIGLVGTFLGVVAGVSVTAQIAWVQRQIEAVTGIDTLPESVYQFSTLPAQLDSRQVAVAVGIAMVLALGATLLPSRQASRLEPVDALRYE
ncbi:MAG: lipoprotein-releasing ABC transporter permease subunit [Myxococcota bacterium]